MYASPIAGPSLSRLSRFVLFGTVRCRLPIVALKKTIRIATQTPPQRARYATIHAQAACTSCQCTGGRSSSGARAAARRQRPRTPTHPRREPPARSDRPHNPRREKRARARARARGHARGEGRGASEGAKGRGPGARAEGRRGGRAVAARRRWLATRARATRMPAWCACWTCMGAWVGVVIPLARSRARARAAGRGPRGRVHTRLRASGGDVSLMSLKSVRCSAGPGRRPPPGPIPFSDSAMRRHDGAFLRPAHAGRRARAGFGATRVRICLICARRRARRPRRTRRRPAGRRYGIMRPTQRTHARRRRACGPGGGKNNKCPSMVPAAGLKISPAVEASRLRVPCNWRRCSCYVKRGGRCKSSRGGTAHRPVVGPALSQNLLQIQLDIPTRASSAGRSPRPPLGDPRRSTGAQRGAGGTRRRSHVGRHVGACVRVPRRLAPAPSAKCAVCAAGAPSMIRSCAASARD